MRPDHSARPISGSPALRTLVRRNTSWSPPATFPQDKPDGEHLSDMDATRSKHGNPAPPDPPLPHPSMPNVGFPLDDPSRPIGGIPFLFLRMPSPAAASPLGRTARRDRVPAADLRTAAGFSSPGATSLVNGAPAQHRRDQVRVLRHHGRADLAAAGRSAACGARDPVTASTGPRLSCGHDRQPGFARRLYTAVPYRTPRSPRVFADLHRRASQLDDRV